MRLLYRDNYIVPRIKNYDKCIIKRLYQRLVCPIFLLLNLIFPPQPIRAVEDLFSPMASGWVDWRVAEKVSLGCVRDTIRRRI